MEQKIPIFKRVPPGDKWIYTGDNSPNTIHQSLTEAIEWYFQQTKLRQYFIDAAAGLIYKVDIVEEPPKPEPRYSIYGDYEYDG